MTWDNVEGLHSTTRKEIIVAETYRSYKKNIYVVNRRVAGTLRHEFGHAVDKTYGDLSMTARYLAAFSADRKAMSAIGRIEMDYLLQGGRQSREETFAEIFCEIMGGGNESGAATYFPNVVQYLKTILGL